MKQVDDIGVAIANVYAKALLDVAFETETEASLLEEYGDFVAYVNESPDFDAFLTGVTVDPDKRREVLEKTLRGKMSDQLLDFVQVLNKKDRLALLEQTCTQFRFAYEASRNQLEVTVSTVTPLTPTARDSLKNALKRYTSADPVLIERVDPSLIGGMVVHVGDEKIDFSVSRRLHAFRETLYTRASHEIHGKRSYFEEA